MSGLFVGSLSGQTKGEERDDQMDVFNAPDSDKFIFMLTTRAGTFRW